MLQKSIIALSTVFALSACGGSLDLGPDTPPPENGNGENGNGNGNGEPGDPQIWTYISFDEEESIESWASRCAEGCNASAVLEWHQDEEALAISPEWASDDDDLEIYTSIDEIVNMDDAAISAWVYVTEDYIVETNPDENADDEQDDSPDGRLGMQMFLVNAEGGTAYTQEYVPNRAGWHKLEAWELRPGTGEEHEDEDMEGIDYGRFVWHSEGFELRNINTFGVQFSANGKPVDVGGDLWIDNVVLTPAAEDDAGPLIVDMDSPNWTLQDGGSLELQREEGRVFFNPDGQQEYSPKIAYMLDGPVDLAGSSFTITFSVDQAFIDDGGTVDAFVQQNFGSYEGNFEEDNNCSIANEDLVADEETVYTCSNLPGFAAAEEGDQLRVGIQVNGAAGTASVHGLEIEGLGDPVDTSFSIVPTADNTDSWDNDNWEGVNGAADLSFSEEQGALVISPNWDATDNDGNRIVMYIADEDELPELEGATIAYELYIPDYYVTEHPGMRYRFFVQQNSDDHDGEFGNEAGYPLEDAEDLGEGWYRFESTFETVPEEPAALRVGLILLRADLDNNGEAGEDLWLRSITID